MQGRFASDIVAKMIEVALAARIKATNSKEIEQMLNADLNKENALTAINATGNIGFLVGAACALAWTINDAELANDVKSTIGAYPEMKKSADILFK